MTGEAALWAAGVGLLGPIVGSFIGLVSLRLPAERDIVAARSTCGGCGRTLGVRDLVPLASYLALRGRCRTCSAQIPRRYPVIEVACGGIGLWAGLATPGPAALLTAILGWTLLLLAILDAEHFWLPDRITLPLGGLGLVAAALAPWPVLLDRGVGVAVGWASLAALAAAYRRLRGREGLGGGDATMFGAIGAWVGWMGLPSVLVWACLAGFSVIAARTLTRGPPRAEEALPFGSFLAVGGWLTWLLGPLGAGVN